MICLDENLKPHPHNCIVYSFGINNEWSFDDEVADFGCTVYSFDPSISTQSFKRRENMFFFPIGVGGSDRTFDESKSAEYKKNRIMRLKSIVKMLGHQNDNLKIDYLKLDVEGEEIYVLLDLLYRNNEILHKFRQIGMEIHPGIYSEETFQIFQAFYQYFKELERQKFKLIYTSMNSVPGNKYLLYNENKVVNGYYELVWGKF